MNSPLKVSSVLLEVDTDSIGHDRSVRDCYVTNTGISTNNFTYPENYNFEERYAHSRLLMWVTLAYRDRIKRENTEVL